MAVAPSNVEDVFNEQLSAPVIVTVGHQAIKHAISLHLIGSGVVAPAVADIAEFQAALPPGVAARRETSGDVLI